MKAYRQPRGPQRIVCLTEEPTEILYQLGQGERVVGISAYTVRPPEAKRDKPVVSAFVGGSVSKIAALEPDLVIGFSDIQADLARELIAANQPVLIFNQRSIQEILEVVVDLGSLVQCRDAAQQLVAGYVARLEAAHERAEARPRRPRVYFEEWDDPMICGIEWVSELIEIAGGEDVFRERARGKLAKERFVDEREVLAADPEIMLASWCGKPLDAESVHARDTMGKISALRNERLFEVPSEIILQPGPACLTDGLDCLEQIIGEVSR
ncbi:MAG: ABC transporter substrate-binding protein [Deltaproteobacteria bacterium]|nr:ABC transporter substrate-binding protein [Deltaproteobacteria bacterium]MBW2387991.1 ABC transporter substrate-binding protein [Deltaproteobacteria bacterium]